MRITRAAKVAAFPLTALILVALVACQGPAGPPGATGQGRTGASGDMVLDPGSDHGSLDPRPALGDNGVFGFDLKSTTPEPTSGQRQG